MRLLHSLAKTHASFDDPNLVSHAGLVPVMALAQRAGLGDLVAGQVRPGGQCGVNAAAKPRPGRTPSACSIPPSTVRHIRVSASIHRSIRVLSGVST